MHRRLAIAILIALIGGCASQERTRLREQRDSTVSGFRSVSYRRTGGILGTDDRLTIAVDGTVQTSGRIFPTGSAHLSEFQIMQLTRLFEGWETLQQDYPAPKGSADTFTIEIMYGDGKVTAADAAAGVPEIFTRVRRRLETMAQDLARSAK